MKFITTLLMILVANSVFATNYYISNEKGDVHNIGSQAFPWNVAKLNAAATETPCPFNAGDQILFRKGETFTISVDANDHIFGVIRLNFTPNNGSPTNRITIGAYTDDAGTAQPIITCMRALNQWNNQGRWTTVTGTHQWRYRLDTFVDFIPRIYFDGVEYAWAKTPTDVDANRRLAFENTDWQYYTVYSPINPALYYHSMESACFDKSVFSMIGLQYAVVRDLDIRGGFGASIEMGGANYIDIINCTIGKQGMRQGTRIQGASHIFIDSCTYDTDFKIKQDFQADLIGGDGAAISDSCQYIKILHTLFKNWRHTGWVVESGGKPQDSLNHIEIAYCEVTAPDVEYGHAIGAYWTLGTDVIYHHNYLHNFPTTIQFAAPNFIFRHNTIKYVQDAKYLDLNPSAYGLLLGHHSYLAQNMTIDSNYIGYCGTGGIILAGRLDVNGDEADVANNIIRANTFEHNGDSVRFWSAAPDYNPKNTDINIQGNADILGNSFINNIFKRASTDTCIYYRAGYITVSRFNQMNGLNGDIVTNNVLNNIQNNGMIIRRKVYITPHAMNHPPIAQTQIATTDEEFVGPFSSWDNVVTKYGLHNDGTDVTTALQLLVDSLGKIGKSTVLYFPHGHYAISNTIFIKAKESVSIIGEDPLTTFFDWNGGTNKEMFNLNGWVYSKFNRFTFNGRGVSNVVAINQSWDGYQGGNFDTGNEYADNIFTDLLRGIQGGMIGYGFAETSITRCLFIRCYDGIYTGNPNALDTWIRDSRFEFCTSGVTSASGNFHVVHCTFKQSVAWDISCYNAEGFSAQDCVSSGSPTFFKGAFTNNAAPILIQRCKILDRTNIGIYIRNQGPVTLLDNVFRNPTSNIYEDCQIFADANVPVIAINNTFNKVTGGGYNNFTSYAPVTNFFIFNNFGQTITDTLPDFGGFAQNKNRRIFEASNSSLQAAIDSAAAVDNMSVVHFNSLNASSTINVPANKKVQIIGDGYNGSIVYADNVPSGQPVFKLNGPNLATLKDFQIKNHPNDYGIEITNADQVGSTFFSYQYEARRPVNANFYYDSLDNMNAILTNSEFLYDGYTATGMIVKGGALTKAGNTTSGKVTRYNLNGATFGKNIALLNKATLTDVNWWNEANTFVPPTIDEASEGNYTLFGARIHSNIDTTHGTVRGVRADTSNITLNGYKGKMTIVGANLTYGLRFKGDGSNMKFLSLGNYMQDSLLVTNTTSPTGDIRMLYSTDRPKGSTGGGYPSELTANYGAVESTYVMDMLSQARSIPVPSIPVKTSNVTSVYVGHVWTNGNGIHIKP